MNSNKITNQINKINQLIDGSLPYWKNNTSKKVNKRKILQEFEMKKRQKNWCAIDNTPKTEDKNTNCALHFVFLCNLNQVESGGTIYE
jgi:hypothetical protein